MNKKFKINKSKLRKLELTKNAFLSLSSSIIYQQISTKAGDSIFRKFKLLFKGKKITPENFLKLNSVQLKSAGLSPQKQSYLFDLAQKFLDRTIHLKHFALLSDEEVKKHLLQVKGIGPWTADMFLIFALNRRDILPVGDLGTKKGFQKAFQLKKLPSEKQMLELAKPYAGRRTDLTLYLWDILK